MDHNKFIEAANETLKLQKLMHYTIVIIMILDIIALLGCYFVYKKVFGLYSSIGIAILILVMIVSFNDYIKKQKRFLSDYKSKYNLQ